MVCYSCSIFVLSHNRDINFHIESTRRTSNANNKRATNNNGKTQTSLGELYGEYERRETRTAKFVKDLDRLEMACQALEYQKQYGIELIPEFFTSVRGKFHFTQVGEYFGQLDAQTESK